MTGQGRFGGGVGGIRYTAGAGRAAARARIVLSPWMWTVASDRRQGFLDGCEIRTDGPSANATIQLRSDRILRQRSGIVRSADFCSSALSLLKNSSIGLRSGEY